MTKTTKIFLSTISICLIIWLITPAIKNKLNKPQKNKFHEKSFAEIPCLFNGRVMPIDTVARINLMQFLNKQSFKGKNATNVFLNIAFKPKVADKWKLFLINHPELMQLFGNNKPKSKMFLSFDDISKQILKIQQQFENIKNIEDKDRNPYQRELAKIWLNANSYMHIRNSLNQFSLNNSIKPNRHQKLTSFYDKANKISQINAQNKGKEINEEYITNVLSKFTESEINAITHLMHTSKTTRYHLIPSFNNQKSNDFIITPELLNNNFNDSGGIVAWLAKFNSMIAESNNRSSRKEEEKITWLNLADATVSASTQKPKFQKIALAFANLGDAYQNDNHQKFNSALKEIHNQINLEITPNLEKRAKKEYAFNNYKPFIKSLSLYIFAFILAVISWIIAPKFFFRTAVVLFIFAFFVHSYGLVMRVIIQGRPPITNLYSSAAFVGWGACLLCLFIEFLSKKGIILAVGAFLGFVSLIIAHQLSIGIDTMESMRAVLDSNFWLATHVVIISFGYVGSLIAAMIGVIFVIFHQILNLFNRKIISNLQKIHYGIICFALFFSFVGTILGGIWADQSWGRFWGWDPKENGALLVVLWNILIIHAKVGGMIRAKGLMLLSIFGAVIVIWAWFGVNLLSVGLHSYGFTNSGAFWTMLSCLIFTVIMIIGFIIPKRFN